MTSWEVINESRKNIANLQKKRITYAKNNEDE
jgi:hypothetical protein